MQCKWKVISALLLLLAAAATGNAQMVRLNSWKYLTDVSTDLNQLFNYNRYEGQRWGVGLQITAPLKYDISRPRNEQNALQLNGYMAYGTYDRALKAGGAAALRLPHNKLRSVGFAVSHDLDCAGSRQLGSYSLVATYNNSNYVTSRYISANRLSFGINQWRVKGADLAFHIRLSQEEYRFDQNGLLYPRMQDAAMPTESFCEGRFTLQLNKKFVLQLQAGHVEMTRDARGYARLIAQYATTKTTNQTRGDKLYVYLQGGITTGSTPFSRLFDLSGTAGSCYFFRNSFMTVAPSTFMAHQYGMFCLHYLYGKPLWTSKISNPQPFLQLTGAWGSLSGSNYGNSLLYSLRREGAVLPTTAAQIQQDNIILLTAPYLGLLEPSLGIERLLRWGVMEMGVACAYQLAPANADYHLAKENRFAWVVMANLILDYDR